MPQKESDNHEVRVSFVALDELLRRPSERLPQIDQKYLTSHARCEGIRKYEFTYEEYERLLNLAEKLKLRKELVQELDKCYCFAYWMTRKVRMGAINSMSGMCYDIALRNYAQIARVIDKKSLDIDEQ